MRRPILSACVPLFLLVSCAAKSDLAPEDVLRRASLRSGSLQSVALDVSADAQLSRSGSLIDLQATVNAVTQDAGKTMQADIDVQAKVTGEDPRTLSGEGRIVAERGGALSFLIRHADVRPSHPVLPNEALMPLVGQWWTTTPAASAGASITPDPRLLTAQAGVIKVVRDNGLQNVRGRPAHRYSVTIDPHKLLAYLAETGGSDPSFDPEQLALELARYSAEGEAWIDVATYDVVRVRWAIRSVPEGRFSLDFTADMHDHDTAPAVRFPEAAMAFDLQALLHGPFTATGATRPSFP